MMANSIQVQPGMHELLSYGILLDEQTILHKDGALSRHFVFSTDDFSTCSKEEIDSISYVWAKAFDYLEDGWLFEVNFIASSVTLNSREQYFPEPVSALIDKERSIRSSKRYLQQRRVLSLTYLPKKSNQLMDLIHMEGTSTQAQRLLGEFNRTVDNFIGYMSQVATFTVLRSGSVINFLYQCLTQQQDSIDIIEPGMIDSLICAEDLFCHKGLKLGDKHISILSLEGLPSCSAPMFLAQLSQLPCHYRWSTRFHVMSQSTTAHQLKRKKREWSSKSIGLVGVIREALGLPVKLNESADAIARELSLLQAVNSSSDMRFGLFDSCLILMDADLDRLIQLTLEVKKLLQQKEFRVKIESLNLLEAYLGSLPCHGGYNIRKMMVDVQFVSHVLPISQAYIGQPQSPCEMAGYKNAPALLAAKTPDGQLFWLNGHVGDVGHMAIMGPTGSGKSTLIAAIMSAHRQYQDSRVVVLDKDRSNLNIVKALGGVYIDFENTNGVLSPLASINNANPSSLDKAFEWLSLVCKVQGVVLDPSQQRLLKDSLSILADDAQEYKNLNHLAVQDKAVRCAIKNFNSGAYQNLLNGTENQFQQSVMGFDIGAFLLEASDNPLSLLVIKAILNQLEALFEDRRPTLLILEEAWMVLRHTVFQERLADWFKTLRKKNVSVVFVSQDLTDITASSHSDVIQNSCMTRIYLPNRHANQPNIQMSYASFGLNQQEIDIIHQAQPKRDYYFRSPQHSALFQLDLGPFAKSLFCMTSPDAISTFHRLCQDANWLDAWLSINNLHSLSDELRSIQIKGSS